MSRPRLVGDGPPTCSTCLDLVPVPLVIYDVNGYYRDLGVDVRATRAEIRQAYLARGQGDVHLTYVVKQLLDPEIRRAYDLTPLGHVFFDAEVAARVRRVLALRVSHRAGSVPARDDTPTPRTLDTVPVSEDRLTRTTWPYAYYLWDADQPHDDRLREWQERLAVALGRQGARLQIAVGLIGSTDQPVEIHRVGYRVAAFLHRDEQPSDALVQRAVSQVLTITHQEIQECPRETSGGALRPPPRPARVALASPRRTGSRSTGTPPRRTTRPSSAS